MHNGAQQDAVHEKDSPIKGDRVQNSRVLDAAQGLASLTSKSNSGLESLSLNESYSNSGTDYEGQSDNPSEMEIAKIKASNVLSMTKKSSKGKAVRFPVKVCDMITNAFPFSMTLLTYTVIIYDVQLMRILDCKAYEDIITWAPDGKSFVVLDAKKFVEHVLTFHFKEAKFTSFLRKASLLA